MFLTQNLLEALDSLSANKLRSALTMLGIVIGVGAVIALLSVGEGAQATISGSINSIGSNLIFVIPGGNSDVTTVRPLTLQDANALADPLNAPDILAVAPLLTAGPLEITAGGKSTKMTVNAVTPPYASVRNVTLSEGDFISQTNLDGRASVAVIGADTADTLFGTSENLVGETIRIGGQPFRIIGIQARKGGSGFSNADDVVFIPYTTATSRFTSNAGGVPDRVNMIAVQATSSESVTAASDEIQQILSFRHHNKVGQYDFSVTTQQDILSVTSQITGVFTVFLGGIAAISLLVGGIGIMNIMLVSVTERTREIGLRKALGARKRDILIQFLTESATLSVAGGLVGIFLGWILALIIGQIAAATGNSFTPVVSLNSVLLATLFSAAVGLFFGIYPSSRAAGLEPVEALRYE